MKWVNIEISSLRSIEYMGSNPVKRATWINVMAYCCEQENGGRIVGARKWIDRQYQQICGVTRREVEAADKLMWYDGDDLVVWRFPHEKQEEVIAKRIAGRDRAMQRWGKQATSSANSSAISSAHAEGNSNRKGNSNNKEQELLIEEIYQAYPRHEAKADALKAIAKAIKTTSADIILAAVKEYAESQNGNPEKQFIPLPASWIRAERWKDDRAGWNAWKNRKGQQPQLSNDDELRHLIGM